MYPYLPMIALLLGLIGGIGPVLRGRKDEIGEDLFPVYHFINLTVGGPRTVHMDTKRTPS